MTQKQKRKKRPAKSVKQSPISMHKHPGIVSSQHSVLPTKAAEASHENPGLNVICKLIQNILMWMYITLATEENNINQ